LIDDKRDMNGISFTVMDPKALKGRGTAGRNKLGKMVNASFAEGNINNTIVRPTVRQYWISQGAITTIAKNAHKAKEAVVRDDDDEGGENEELEEMPNSSAPSKAGKAAKDQLDAHLFSRWMEGRSTRGGKDGAQTIPGKFWAVPGETEDADEEVGPLADDVDLDEVQEQILKLQVSGHEVWLDCLVTALEREMEEESLITTLLRTNDMQELAQAGKNQRGGGAYQHALCTFYQNASKILEILELKAQSRYFKELQFESEKTQHHVRNVNQVFHDYICVLETTFTRVVNDIHTLQQQKNVALRSLALTVDGDVYKDLDGDDLKSQAVLGEMKNNVCKLTPAYEKRAKGAEGSGRG